MKITSMLKGIAVIALGFALAGCMGERVEVPPAHIGKISTKDGYQEGLIPTSKFRLDPCWWPGAYCDRLVTLDVSDQPYREKLQVFIPEDKLNIDVEVRTTLSVDPRKTAELFSALPPKEIDSYNSSILKGTIYQTYAQQIVVAETREYLSQFSIAEIASNVERMNTELGERISKTLTERTPFIVRHAGITGMAFPKIITDAQEQAAERREAIQQEEAQREISIVRLNREYEEARLQRAIEKEKAETEADAQRVLAQSVDSRVLELRRLENEKLWIEKWGGGVPQTVMGGNLGSMNLMMGVPQGR